MSLLEELQSLDLSGIVDARATISAAVESPELQAVLSGGAAQTALAGLGTSLGTLRDTFDEPSALVKPLVDAVAELAGPLSLDDVPVVGYLEAVREGASIMAGLFQGLDGDPTAFGRAQGFSLGQALDGASSVIGSYTQVGLDDLARFRRLLDMVERGVPTDPQAFADLAIDVLLPFPRAALAEMRNGLTQILDGASAIALPHGRTAGLVVALDAVASAAATADATALERALRDLARVRANTVASIRDDLLAVFELIGRLRVEETLDVVVSAGGALRAAEEGVLEFLDTWRAQIGMAREHVENLDPAQITPFIPQVLQLIEDHARAHIVEPIDALVRRLEEWIRGLLRHLPLRALRAELSRFFHSVAQAIQDADLDRYARAVREMLDEIRSFIESADLGADIRAALEDAGRAIGDALDDVISALETIGTEINAVAGEAEAILERTAGMLADFQVAVDGITAAVDSLGIEQAAQEVVDTLTELRETAEELLSVAPLPEPLRPLVEQLIDTLENVDFEVVFRPVRAALAEFEVPDEVSATVTEALQAAGDALENLIPAELIASIEAEINDALDVIRDFDPSTLLNGVTDFLNEAADFIESLDPRPLAEEIRGPYQAVLDAIDAAHPRVLLAPAIEAYDALLGNIPVPSPETAVRRTAEVVGAAGEGIARSVVEPVRQLAPPGAVDLTEPGRVSGPQEAPQLEGVRPGDVIRMFGYLPDKLRETLADLDEGAAGEALGAIDALCGGLARDLRDLQARLWDIEARVNAGMDELVAPLGEAQLRAQLAIQANFSAGSFNVDAALEAVAQAGPGPMRAALADVAELACGRARKAATSAGGQAGGALESAANALERCRLSGLGADLDALLAALDPEPIAAELDALVVAALEKAPELLSQIEDDLQAAAQRIQSLILELNPGVQAQKLLAVLDVLRQELDLLNPRRLAAELGEVHTAIRQTLVAYDPAVFTAEIHEVLSEVAHALRALDPAALLGDLSFLDATLDRVEAAVPTDALAGVGESLAEVGERLATLNPAGLLEALERLGPKLVEAFEKAVEAIRREIIALLESLRYASGAVSVTAEVEVG